MAQAVAKSTEQPVQSPPAGTNVIPPAKPPIVQASPRPEVEALLKSMSTGTQADRNKTWSDIQALGRPAIPTLLAIISDSSADVFIRRIAATMISYKPFSSAETPAELLKALSTGDPKFDVAVLESIGRLGKEGFKSNDAALAGIKFAQSPDQRLRIGAIHVLEAYKSEETSAELIKLTQDSSAEVRAQVIRGLDVKDPGSRKIVLLASEDKSAEVRLEAISAVRYSSSSETHEMALRLVRDPDVEVRKEALRALAFSNEFANERTLPLLIEALKDTSEEVRVEGAMALGWHSPKKQPVTPEQNTILLGILDTESSQKVRIVLVDSIAKLKLNGAAEKFVEFLGRDSEEMRLAGIGGLRVLRENNSAAAIIQAVDDRAIEVRLRALETIGSLQLEAGIPKVLSLVGSTNEKERDTAIRALINLADYNEPVAERLRKDTKLSAQILSLLQQPANPNAVELAGQLRLTDSVPIMESLFREENDSYQKTRILRALERVRPTKEILTLALNDPEKVVRSTAISITSRLKDKSLARQLIQEARNTETDTSNLNEIRSVLMSLGDAQAIKDLAASLRSADSETRRNAFSRITYSSRDLIDGILPALLEVAKDPDPAIRSSVYLTLADLAFGNDTARAVVFSALIDPDQFARRQAAEAILNRRIFLNRDVNKQVQQAVEKAVESSDPLIRQAALHALFDSGMAKSDKMLMGLFQDSNPSVRIKAMKASAFIERPEFVSAFVKALSDQDAGVRRLALSNFRYKRAPDSSFEQVRTLLRSDTLEDVRAEAAQALTYSTHPDSLSALVEALKDPSARVRIAVLESLGTASNEHAAKVVAAVTPLALGEPSQEVRAAAIVALRNHRPDNLLQILNEVITNATSETLVRVKAVSALDYVRNDDERAAGEIARALLRNDSDPKVREQAAQVLGYIKAEAFKEDFISALSDPSEEVQAAAIAGLGKIGTVEVIQSLLPLFERATGPMRDRLESGMKEAALRSVRRINEMHDSTEFSEATRYASVANVDRKVLYHLMVLAEEELFTSTYNGLYSRLRDKMRTGTPVNGAQLLEENGNYGFRDFLKLASNYNQLDNFLQTMDVPLQEGLIKRFATGFHKERDRLEQAVAVADTIGTLTNARVLRTVADTLEQNFKQLETTDKRSADLYGLLGALYKDRSVTTPWLQEANKDYQLPDLSKLDVNALFQPNGKHIQHHFFYHDEGKAPDGTNSFNHFKATYAGRPGWNMETHDGYIIIRSTGPKVVEIYANDPTVDEKGIDSILARFKESNIEPQAVFHRGHSYHVDKTLRHLKPSVKLVSLGSCGGYNNVNEVLSKAPEAAIISTKGVGTMLVNDPLFKLLNDHLRTGQQLVWGQFWGMVERQPFARNRDFRNYIPPHKNYGVTYLVAERRLSQLSKTSQ